MDGAPILTIVIPTRGRVELLRRCVGRVNEQMSLSSAHVELIIVDDAGLGEPRVGNVGGKTTILRSGGKGPAAARNVGLSAAKGTYVAFTDDDALVNPQWLQSVIEAMEAAPHSDIFTGPVVSPAFDPVYEHSVEDPKGLVGLTCNIAYRRTLLLQLGGFDERFRFPAGEDQDLLRRAKKVGTHQFVSGMRVTHPPRTVSILSVWRRGRLVEGDWSLHLKHIDTRPPRWSVRWGPLVRMARFWGRVARKAPPNSSPRNRLVRLGVLSGGQLGIGLWTTITKWRHVLSLFKVSSSREPCLGQEVRKLRVAYVGPLPTPDDGGVSGAAWLVVRALSNLGHEVDCYVLSTPEAVSEALRALPGVRLSTLDTGWRWERWYSRGPLKAHLTGQLSLALGRLRLGGIITEQQSTKSYDVLYQFSTLETIGLRRRRLPPVVLHPQVHAAGELRALRKEWRLIARSKGIGKALPIGVILWTRARNQRRSIANVDHVVGISKNFRSSLQRDCKLLEKDVTVIPSPIDLNRFRVGASTRTQSTRVNVAVVGRISARKGIDRVVTLSHALQDLSDYVQIEIRGEHSLWSDYRPILADLNTSVAHYGGRVEWQSLPEWFADKDILIQAASYEPFGLTVAEALASGVPVLATTVVGATEGVSQECCRTVPPDDAAALELSLRQLIEEVRDPRRRAELAGLARREAARLWEPQTVGVQIASVLSSVARSAVSRNR